MDNWSSKKNLLMACALSSLAGGIGVSGSLITLPLILLFAAGLSFARAWWHGVLAAFCYYASASHGLYLGAYDFTSGSISAMLVAPTVAFALLAFSYCLVTKLKSIGLVVALMLVTLPPLGFIGWASPFVAAGLFFPGLGFIGIALFAALFIATYRRPYLALVAPLVVAFWFFNPPALPQSNIWVAQNTNLNNLMEATFNRESDYKTARAVIREVNNSESTNLLLPEGVFGIWSRTNESLWRRRVDFTNLSLIGGGEIKTDDGRLLNALIVLDNEGAKPVYESRIPVPYFMTRNSEGYFKRGDSNGTFEYAGSRYGGLICYEAYLAWTVLQTQFNQPEEVFVVGNYWWANRTNLVSIVETKIRAWSLLFSTPYTLAYNQ